MRMPAHYQSLEYVRVERLIREWAHGRTQPLRVLDFGCGRGKYLACFAALGCTVTGVDSNPAYVEEARAAVYDRFVTTEENRCFLNTAT